MQSERFDATRAVSHNWLDLDGMRIFYREAGTEGMPVLLLPHGYPCSSYEFRNLIPLLADRYHLLAPDFPGQGYSDTPGDFAYDFDGYTDFLERFLKAKQVDRFAIYLHDFGSQIGLRLAIRDPQRVSACIIQNGDIYEDVLGPKYEGLKAHFDHPSAQTERAIRDAISEDGYREEFLNDVPDAMAAAISPDLWTLHWSLTTPERQEIIFRIITGLKENLAWFARYQAYLREHQPPTLILWGPNDGYMPAKSGEAYLRDLPKAELHMFDGGHWLLETHLDRCAELIGDFLQRNVSR